jgi:hypothetical protein
MISSCDPLSPHLYPPSQGADKGRYWGVHVLPPWRRYGRGARGGFTPTPPSPIKGEGIR